MRFRKTHEDAIGWTKGAAIVVGHIKIIMYLSNVGTFINHYESSIWIEFEIRYRLLEYLVMEDYAINFEEKIKPSSTISDE